MRKLFLCACGAIALVGSLYAVLFTPYTELAYAGLVIAGTSLLLASFKKTTSEVTPAALSILAVIGASAMLWFFPKAIACIVVVIVVKLLGGLVFDRTVYEDAKVEL